MLLDGKHQLVDGIDERGGLGGGQRGHGRLAQPLLLLACPKGLYLCKAHLDLLVPGHEQGARTVSRAQHIQALVKQACQRQLLAQGLTGL